MEQINPKFKDEATPIDFTLDQIRSWRTGYRCYIVLTLGGTKTAFHCEEQQNRKLLIRK